MALLVGMALALSACSSGVQAPSNNILAPATSFPESTSPAPPADNTGPRSLADSPWPPPSVQSPWFPPATSAPPTLTYTHVTNSWTCALARQGSPLTLSTTDAEEAQHLPQWDACLSNVEGVAYTWIHNRTAAVWVLPGIQWNETRAHISGPTTTDVNRFIQFHSVVANSTLPKATLYLSPGASVMIARHPEGVRWELDLPLTLAWEAQGLLLDMLRDKVPGALANALTPADSVYRAVAVCAIGVYKYVSELKELDGTEGSAMVLAGLNTRSEAVDCYEEASQAQVRLKSGQVGTLQEDVLRAAPEESLKLGTITNNVKPLKNLGSRLAQKFVTRGRG